MSIDEKEVFEYLRLNADGRLHHREGQELEFKEQFSLSALADYFRDFAAFANNRGGYLIFGVKDRPRSLGGMSEKSIEQFEKVDPERITGNILELFSSEIRWFQCTVKINEMTFGVFRILPSNFKPVIAKKDEGKDQSIKNGDIYYRYSGRTQKIQSAELENIINARIEQNNQNWLDLMAKIGRAGPENAVVLDTERALIEKDDAHMLVLDEKLASQIKFIKEGEFVEKDGATALKLVGEIVPINQIEVVKHVKENLTKEYPLSAMELADAVRKSIPDAKQGDIWNCIRDNGLKDDSRYSAYNFRYKKHEDEYKKTGIIPSGTPSIYKHAALEFIINVIKSNNE